MRQGEVRDGRWWDWGSWWRWWLVRPLGWHLAGLRERTRPARLTVAFHVAGWRDQLSTWRANRDRDIVR